MTKWKPPTKPEPFVPWKPDVCEAPGCTARHPSFSAGGTAGPWTCAAHRGLTHPPPRPLFDDPPAPSRTSKDPPAPPDRLL